MAAPNEITPARLLRLIGLPDAPVLVDTSIDPDFDDDPFLIPRFFRHPHTDVDGLVAKLNGCPSIFTCQQGNKLLQGRVALLRNRGLVSEYFAGGNYAWRALAGVPRIPATAIPAPVSGGILWVTRQRPKIDRIACLWLIRRFVDPSAKFLFVSPAQVHGVAERYGATPSNVADTFWCHRGANCTFDTMLDEFALHTQKLDQMAQSIPAEDSNTHTATPEAAGLLALSVGLSRQYKDGQAQPNAHMALYDTLYRWARDGQGETHHSTLGPT